MKKTVIPFFLLALIGTAAHAQVRVVTTLQWIGSVAKDLGGDNVEVTSLVKSSQDPHMVEAKPSMILAVRKADVLMYNGLDLEIGYLPVLIESSRNANVQPGQAGNFDCSQFVTVIERPLSVDRSMGDVHPLGNPHYQYSAAAIRRIAEGMTQRLSRLDPGNAALYARNLAAFREKLEAKRKEWSSLPLQGKRFVAYHKLFEYLAAEYGFRIVGYVEPKPGIPPSAGYIERLIDTITDTRPDGILTTPIYGRKEVQFLAEKTGVRSIVIPQDVGAMPRTGDWFSMMDRTLNALVR